MGWNEPDDWNSYYSRCTRCGARIHASGCDRCACEHCEHEECTEWGPLDVPKRDALDYDHHTITLEDGSIVCPTHGECAWCGARAKKLGELLRMPCGDWACPTCAAAEQG